MLVVVADDVQTQNDGVTAEAENKYLNGDSQEQNSAPPDEAMEEGFVNFITVSMGCRFLWDLRVQRIYLRHLVLIN